MAKELLVAPFNKKEIRKIVLDVFKNGTAEEKSIIQHSLYNVLDLREFGNIEFDTHVELPEKSIFVGGKYLENYDPTKETLVILQTYLGIVTGADTAKERNGDVIIWFSATVNIGTYLTCEIHVNAGDPITVAIVDAL